MDGPNLTPGERAVLGALVDAWNRWTRLGGKHPDDDDDFRSSLHRLQDLVAVRVARRADPDVWSFPGPYDKTPI